MVPYLPATLQRTLIGILQKCRQNKDLDQAKRLLAHLRGKELESHPVLGNHIVPMFVDCGSLPDAQQAFDRIHPPHRNIVSWTSLISAYVDIGDPLRAFHLYHTMMQQPDLARPNRCTYLSLLSACARMNGAERGRGLHADIIKLGLDKNVLDGSAVMGNTLVDMYGKCGLVADACKVFDQLPVRNAVSWNALIAGFTKCGFGEEARNRSQQMQLAGILPDSFTFVCSLKACGTKGLETGQALHAESIKRGFEKILYVGNTLVDMYTKTGSLAEALSVFDALSLRDLVSWNALIAGYAEHGLAEEAGDFLQRMQADDSISPDSSTFFCILKACSNKGALETGHMVHSESTKRGLERELFVGTILVEMYSKCSSLAEACHVHYSLPARDVVSWNVLFAGYAEHGLDEEVLDCFSEMRREGMPADAGIYVICLKACGNIGALEIGRELHAEIRKAGLEGDLFVGSMLISMYGKCGSVAEGREMFDKLPVRDIVSWNAMIDAYGENHEGDMAVQCFEDMQGQCVKPDSITFVCLLAACSHSSLVLKGQQFFKAMQDHAVEPTMDHYACMVDLLARSGYVCEAEKLVAAMQHPPSMVILKALLTACKSYGEVELGERCFQLLLEADQELATGYLLMSDIYASACRWRDVHKLEEMKSVVGAKKMPGKTFIEVDRKLHGFVVGVNLSEHLLEMLGGMSLRMEDEGYVPNLDTVFAS